MAAERSKSITVSDLNKKQKKHSNVCHNKLFFTQLPMEVLYATRFNKAESQKLSQLFCVSFVACQAFSEKLTFMRP